MNPSDTPGPAAAMQLPLFPLRSVLFPGGMLPLRVYEARYLDLVSRCLREGQPFGVVCLRQGAEVGHGKADAPVLFEDIGTLAHLQDVDSDQAGILKVTCRGGQRFQLGDPAQSADGLWSAWVRLVDEDALEPPHSDHDDAVQALQRAIGTLSAQGEVPFFEPYRFDDAGWVANRWCEILPISLSARQHLMVLPDATARLGLVAEFLRRHDVIA